MNAKNVQGEKIVMEGSYLEVACLAEIVNDYISRNPNAIDLDIAREWARILRNPEVDSN